MVPFEHVFHRIRAGHPTLRVGQVQRTAVAVGRVGFVGREEKRLEPLVKKRDATHADGPKRVAVVGQPQVQETLLGLVRAAPYLPVLVGHLQGHFHRR